MSWLSDWLSKKNKSVQSSASPAPASPGRLQTGDTYHNPTSFVWNVGEHDKQQAAVQADKDAAEKAENERIAKAKTARLLEMLRQGVMGGENTGIERLRANLAQRGLLDSGSLPAGINQIVGEGNQQLAQGTMAAANQESDTLLDLLKAQRQRQFEEHMQQLGFAQKSQMLERLIAEERDKERRRQRAGLWGTAGSAIGGVLGTLLLPGVGTAAGSALGGALGNYGGSDFGGQSYAYD